MAELMNGMEWGEPILPIVNDPEWEAEVKSDIGFVPDIMKRVSRSKWIRKACLKWARYEVTEFPKRLGDIAMLVTAQENACRYCYGVARSQLRLFGYSEKMINQIEKRMQLAELDEKERTFILFCRNLSRSIPRPPKADRDKLISLGFSQLAVAEMAFFIANMCFINRVATFISCLPMYELEKISGSFLGKIFRPFIAKNIRNKSWTPIDPLPDDLSAFSEVTQTLKGLPAASVINEGLQGVFSSNVLSNELKVLMFAVVARSLDCRFCISESRNMANDLGVDESEYNKTLTTLTSRRLNSQESKIFSWTRETVHYETGNMHKRMHALATEVDEEILLEAIGVAALANSVVRLAVLLR